MSTPRADGIPPHAAEPIHEKRNALFHLYFGRITQSQPRFGKISPRLRDISRLLRLSLHQRLPAQGRLQQFDQARQLGRVRSAQIKDFIAKGPSDASHYAIDDGSAVGVIARARSIAEKLDGLTSFDASGK